MQRRALLVSAIAVVVGAFLPKLPVPAAKSAHCGLCGGTFYGDFGHHHYIEWEVGGTRYGVYGSGRTAVEAEDDAFRKASQSIDKFIGEARYLHRLPPS